MSLGQGIDSKGLEMPDLFLRYILLASDVYTREQWLLVLIARVSYLIDCS